MSAPVRVRLSRRKGWRKPENTVVVSRPSRWGNPYTVKEHGRVTAVRLYIDHLTAHPELRLQELTGRNLACWCKPDEVCHADLLLYLANETIAADCPTFRPGALLLPEERS